MSKLTESESEVLRWIAQGKSNAEIAVILALSPRAVKYHRDNLMRSLDIHNTAALTHWAIATGITPLLYNRKGELI